MDGELEQKLDRLLNSPEGMAKIGQMMAALGMNESAAPPPAEPPAAETAPDLSGLLRLAPLMSQLGKDDENTALLKALRPYLSGDKERRLDETMKLMRLLKVLPMLREGGNLL